MHFRRINILSFIQWLQSMRAFRPDLFRSSVIRSALFLPYWHTIKQISLRQYDLPQTCFMAVRRPGASVWQRSKTESVVQTRFLFVLQVWPYNKTRWQGRRWCKYQHTWPRWDKQIGWKMSDFEINYKCFGKCWTGVRTVYALAAMHVRW